MTLRPVSRPPPHNLSSRLATNIFFASSFDIWIQTSGLVKNLQLFYLCSFLSDTRSRWNMRPFDVVPLRWRHQLQSGELDNFNEAPLTFRRVGYNFKRKRGKTPQSRSLITMTYCSWYAEAWFYLVITNGEASKTGIKHSCGYGIQQIHCTVRSYAEACYISSVVGQKSFIGSSSRAPTWIWDN